MKALLRHKTTQLTTRSLRLTALLSLALLPAAIGAKTKQVSTTDTDRAALKEADQQLIYGEVGRIDTFDPYTAHEASGHRLSDLIFSDLIEIGPSRDYQPGLAQSWEIDPNQTTVTLSLRKDVLWHDSSENLPRPFTADDIVTTVRLLKAEQSEIPNNSMFQAIKYVEKLDSHRVRIVFSKAVTDPLRLLTFKILPSHLLGAAPALKRSSSFASSPVGTGPYRFVEAKPQGEIYLQANAGYFKGKPGIATIVMKSYSDQSVMAQSLMYQSLDLVTYVSPRDLGEVQGDKRLSIMPYDALSYSFFALNTQRGILKDKVVRQAISQAINKEEMIQAFFNGRGTIISGPFPPTSWAYNLDVKPYQFNPTQAKAMLQRAGLKDSNGDGVLETPNGRPIHLTLAVPLAGEGETVKRIVVAFQAYLMQVGIKTELEFMDWLVWKKKVLGEHDYDITIASWSFDDASNILSLFHSGSAEPWGNNFVQFKNQNVDTLLTEADASNDFDKKRAIYHKLHAVLAEEAPYIYLWNLKHHAAYSKNLKGVRIEPFAFFKHIKQWEKGL